MRKQRLGDHDCVLRVVADHAATEQEPVVVVGQQKALAIAVRNNKTEQRFSGLLARLLVPS
jgi:hypothetical protein